MAATLTIYLYLNTTATYRTQFIFFHNSLTISVLLLNLIINVVCIILTCSVLIFNLVIALAHYFISVDEYCINPFYTTPQFNHYSAPLVISIDEYYIYIFCATTQFGHYSEQWILTHYLLFCFMNHSVILLTLISHLVVLYLVQSIIISADEHLPCKCYSVLKS